MYIWYLKLPYFEYPEELDLRMRELVAKYLIVYQVECLSCEAIILDSLSLVTLWSSCTLLQQSYQWFYV